MTVVAADEWRGASTVHLRRRQPALGLAGGDDALELRVTAAAEQAAELPDMQLGRLSSGASFVFTDRGRGLPALT